MKTRLTSLILLGCLLASVPLAAQEDEADSLKMAALEALIVAPSDRALPLVMKILDGNESPEFKERALFILSQIRHPDARAKLLDVATNNAQLRHEAIRMIGISGHSELVSQLGPIYQSGDAETRASVLEAYLITGDSESVYQIAVNTDDPKEFEEAVNMLGIMGGREELRKLRERGDMSESIIHAMAISGDTDALLEMAKDSSDIDRQVNAIEALGISGGGGPVLIDIYKASESPLVREAVMHGLLMSGHDDGVIDLYRASDSIDEKKALLELLVMMGSDQAMEIIDDALSGGQ